jgi:hypothetical protein
MLLRTALLLGSAVAVGGADLAVKASVTTIAWDYHPRSHAWSLLAIGLLVGLVPLALLPSKLVAASAGTVAGAVLGNVVSGRLHGGAVPNPLVAGGVAFNLADVAVLACTPVLMVALARVAIRNRDRIDRLIPPRRWELALRRRIGL